MMLVPHDFADSTGFDMHISQATIDPLFSFPSPLSFLFLIRSYSEKHSRGIEFKEILRVQDGIVSHNIRRDSLDLKSYLFREVAHFVLSQQGPVVVPAVSKLLQHPSYTINSLVESWWWPDARIRMQEIDKYTACPRASYSTLSLLEIRHSTLQRQTYLPLQISSSPRCLEEYHPILEIA